MTWNNVKEKMPTEFDKYGNSPLYLVHEYGNDIPFIGYFKKPKGKSILDVGMWKADTSNYSADEWAVCDNIDSNCVDFWMELPAEPKEG